MKLTSTKRFNRFLLAAMSVLLLLSSVLSFTGMANAVPAVSYDDKAASVQIYTAIDRACNMSSKMSDDDAQNYRWFEKGIGGNADIYPGTFAAGGSTDPVRCYTGDGSVIPFDEIFKRMWPTWGLSDKSYEESLKAIGYNQEGNGFWYPNNGDVGAAKSKLLNYIKSVKPELFVNDDSLKYFIWYDAFVNQCGASERTAADDIAKANKGQDHFAKIQFANNDGTVTVKYYYLDKSYKDEVSVGFDVGANAGSKANCREVSAKLFSNKAWATAYAAAAKAGTAPPTPSAGTTAANSNVDGCYGVLAVFGWMFCPLLDLADGIYGFLRSSIFSLLAIPELTGNSKEGLQASWAAVRTIANTLLVLVALFMIASQVFNFSFVDAYTVKKVLPRLVIAAILIQLSWFLFTTMIELFNALGYGLNTLVTAPFQAAGGGGDIVDIIGNSDQGDVLAARIFTGAGFAVGGVALVGFLESGGMLMLALVAIGVIISIVTILLTLIIRKLLLIALLITAPIALVAWILPNTQKFWNSWWQLFSKLLIMFPLIALLFAAGQIFATVIAKTSSANSLDGGVKTIAVIVAYFAPLFLIPATFKFAGGLFGSIVGSLNNISGKAKNSGMFGLRDQAKANRQAVKEYRKAEGFKDLNEGVTGMRRLRARYRTGTLREPSWGDGKAAYDKRDKKAKLQGLLAANEEDNLTSKYLDDEAQVRLAQWATGQESFAEEITFQGKTYNAGEAISSTDKGHMGALAVTGDLAQRRAALRQLQQLRGDAEMRAVQDAYVQADPGTMPDGAVEQFIKIQNTEFFPSFKDVAADLAKGGPSGGFKEFKSQEMRTWSPDTIKAAAQHISTLKADTDTATSAKGRQLEAQFNEAIHEIANDPSNPSGALSPEARMAVRKAFEDGLVSGDANDRFNADGTFNRAPRSTGYNPNNPRSN